jgi:ABC-type glutathione transport system ATPase component
MSGLVIDELGVRFAKRDGSVYRPIRSCSLIVAPGEMVGLVGESGCGKSLTFRLEERLQGGLATATMAREARAISALIA